MGINGIESIPFSDKNVSSFIESLKEVNIESSYYLLILAGPYRKGKDKILSTLSRSVGPFQEVSLRDIISSNAGESCRKIDALFEKLNQSDKNVLFSHGDILCGEYTGFTYSVNRYATPQEKHLLKKVQTCEKIVILDLHDPENIDHTLRRMTQKVLFFARPASFLGRLMWKLKQVSVHGHTFSNKRSVTA